MTVEKNIFAKMMNQVLVLTPETQGLEVPWRNGLKVGKDSLPNFLEYQ